MQAEGLRGYLTLMADHWAARQVDKVLTLALTVAAAAAAATHTRG